MPQELLLTIISGLLLLTGLLGAILPLLPGPPLSLAGLVLYGLATHFTRISVTAVIIFSVLTALTLLLDILAPALGAKGYKASRGGTWGAILGAVFGLLVLGPAGIIFGPLLGAFLGEYLAVRNSEQALGAAWGAFLGFLLGTAVRLGVSVAMAGYFVYALF